ncbi:MAG TPA: DapH/DapD/GlmU-related protein [Gemmatimonadaceae bacterium]|nr:DapH/DapD/GlmU-related protein [Gemmatimonadaceae bacterium]
MLDRLLHWITMVFWRTRQRTRRSALAGLSARGLKIGRDVVIMPDVTIDTGYPWLIEIEDGCRISSQVRIMAHDATSFRELGVTRIGRVRILRESFIGERSIILPGVTIGPRAMIAAGSLVTHDIGPGQMAAGNPARVYGKFEDYLQRVRTTVADSALFSLDSMDSPASREAARAALDEGKTVYVHGSSPGAPDHYNITEAEIAEQARAAFEKNFGKQT